MALANPLNAGNVRNVWLYVSSGPSSTETRMGEVAKRFVALVFGLEVVLEVGLD